MIAQVPGHCILVTFKPSKKEKLSYMCMVTLFRKCMLGVWMKTYTVHKK